SASISHGCQANISALGAVRMAALGHPWPRKRRPSPSKRCFGACLDCASMPAGRCSGIAMPAIAGLSPCRCAFKGGPHSTKFLGLNLAKAVIFPAAQVNKEHDVIRHEPTQCPDFGSKEIGRDQHLHVRADKLLPRGGHLPLWGRWDTMPL